MAALIQANQGSTIPNMSWSPRPSSPSMALWDTLTSVAVTGLEALPRNPSPSNVPATFKPAASAGTSQMVLRPSAASGRLDHT
jgi:hypothetical protein